MSSSKKYILPIITLIALAASYFCGWFIASNQGLPALPKPEVSEGQRGELGIDKNINESNIDKYLGRSDAIYRDMRMLEDPANYEAIGGDRWLSGLIKGFEVVPLPYLVNIELPEAVGKTYSGDTLYTRDAGGKLTANYKESLQILEDLFPRDKIIFLMCGGGGYAGATKQLLVDLGWNGNNIYNVGGYWYYEGKNSVQTITQDDNGIKQFAFWKIPYHDIDFSKLTKK